MDFLISPAYAQGAQQGDPFGFFLPMIIIFVAFYFLLIRPQQKKQKEHAALVGQNPKEEAYYFPEGLDMGPHPETFFGVHPYIAEQKQYELLLAYLEDWNSDLILRHARAYQQVAGEGFHIPAGVLHAPGSALTIELQEDSDVFAMLQARVGRFHIDKELLFKDVRPEDRKQFRERIVLDFIDWPTNGDPYFFENRHTPPVLIEDNPQRGGQEYWIFYNSDRFSGKKLVIQPGQTFESKDAGVYNLLVWQGKGRFGNLEVRGGDPDLDALEKFETEIMLHYTLDEKVRYRIDNLTAPSRATP